MDSPLFWTIFEWSISLLENVLLVWFVASALGAAPEKKRLALWGAAGAVLIGFLFSFVENEPPIDTFEIPITIAILLIYAHCCLQGPLLRKLIVCVIARMLTMLSNSLVVFTCSAVLGVDGMAQNESRVVLVLLTKFLYFFLSRLTAAFFRRRGNLPAWQWISIGVGFLMSNISGSMAIALIHDFPLEDHRARVRMLLVVFMIWVICLLFYFTVARMMKDNDLRTENQLLRQGQAYQQQQVRQMQESNQRIAAVKHDLKNYVGMVEALIRQGKPDQALEKCQEVTGLIDQVQVQLKTGSDAIDAVLNEKIAQSKLRGIDTKCSVFCDTSTLPALAFCSVFGNLMDNAMEAQQELPPERRRITVELVNRFGMNTLRVTNAVARPVLAANPELKTTKKDEPGQHGLGHKSVARTLREQGGSVHYREQEGLFIAEAVFPA